MGKGSARYSGQFQKDVKTGTKASWDVGKLKTYDLLIHPHRCHFIKIFSLQFMADTGIAHIEPDFWLLIYKVTDECLRFGDGTHADLF